MGMIYKRVILIFLGLFMGCLAAKAQEVYIPEEKTNLPATTESWNGLYLKLRLSEKWWWYQENHYRRRNSIDNRSDFVGRMSQLYNMF